MDVALVYSPALNAYDFGPEHPLRPERVSLAVGLMSALDLVREGALRPVDPRPATREELTRVHDELYIDEVVRAGSAPDKWLPAFGIGPGDTPAFPDMHEAAALVAGATLIAVEEVLAGRFTRSLSPAGGLHHAHRDHAAGFCVYNDVAVGIAAAIAEHPRLRVLYIDIDAHHGDGVQEAFYSEPRVLTVSLHESGRYLFPGTGEIDERGAGPGLGSAINVPLPPNATDECYEIAFSEVVVPAARAFRPHLIVTQNGADAHWTDPLTTLGMTLAGYRSLVRHTVRLADELTAGRIVACGGGGYAWATVVPRAWTLLAAELAGVEVAHELPEAWKDRVRSLGAEPPVSLSADLGPGLDPMMKALVLSETRRVVARVRESASLA
jgi:acetoin utilization protein AcuC